MKPSFQMKLPEINPWALAGSLCLHAGLVALCAFWPWKVDAPRKPSPKIVQVKFITPSPLVETRESQSETKTARPVTPGLPAKPRPLPSIVKARFQPRLPEPEPLSPTLPVQARQVNVRTVSALSPRTASRAYIAFQEMGKPHTPRSIKGKTLQTETSHVFKVRKMPVAEGQTTSPGQASVSTRVQSDPQVLAHVPRSPAPAVPFSGHGPSSISPAKATLASATVSSGVHPLPGPKVSKFLGNPEPDIQRMVSETPEAHRVAALPRSISSVSADPLAEPQEDIGALRGMFTGQVRRRIARVQVYPRMARRRGMEGQPVIAFTLDKKGTLTDLRLEKTSGYQLLDRAALEAVQLGAPYPEIPAPLHLETFQFKLPISFILK